MNIGKLLAMPLFALSASVSLAEGQPVGIVPDSLEVTVGVNASVDTFTAKVEGGELTVTADAAAHSIGSAVYTFEWSGVKTGKVKRDHEMLKWAETEKFPKGTFTLKSVETNGDKHLAKGSLEFHGVSRDIEFPVEIAASGAGLKVSGTATIDHREWGLKQIRKFLVFTVDPTVTVSFKFETTGPS